MSSAVKTLCDGVVPTRQLHSNSGYKTKEINAKLLATDQRIAIFDVGYDDSGLTRRLCYYKFKNKFSGVNRDMNIVDKVYSEVERSVLVYFTAYYGNQNFARPPVCQSGEEIFSLKTFETLLLDRRKDSMISIEDFFTYLRKLFPDSRYEQKEIEDFLNKIEAVAVDKTLMCQNLCKELVKGSIKGFAWNSDFLFFADYFFIVNSFLIDNFRKEIGSMVVIQDIYLAMDRQFDGIFTNPMERFNRVLNRFAKSYVIDFDAHIVDINGKACRGIIKDCRMSDHLKTFLLGLDDRNSMES
jgi:hypothetical protein